MLEEPIVEDAHGAPFQSGRSACKPVGIWALGGLAEQLDQAVVDRAGEMAFEHEGDSETAGRSIENQLASVEIVDVRRLKARHADRLAPFVEQLRHLAMEQDRHSAQVRRLPHISEL